MTRKGSSRLCLCCVLAGLFMLLYTFGTCHWGPKSYMVPNNDNKYLKDKDNHVYRYDKDMPLIFIGGVPRSGTTLMRAMLDAHPDIRCGEETRVIPRILGMRASWQKSQKEALRLQEAGITNEVLDSALAAFILEIIARHGEPAPRLCNKDPFALKSTLHLANLFPNSKFILMVRDGRATVHSIINRHVTISGFDLKSYKSCLSKWNQAIETMYYQCLRLGPDRCMAVRYEYLVLHPEKSMHAILDFLEVPWHSAVLHHQDFINKPGGVSLSKTERSTDQVVKPVNLEALTKWVSAIPEDIKKDMDSIAPMLYRLGYDPSAYPPNYGEADSRVAENTKHIQLHSDYWSNRLKEVQSHKKQSAMMYRKTSAHGNITAAKAAAAADYR